MTELKIIEDPLNYLQITNIRSNFAKTEVGPAKDKSPRKGTAKNPMVLLKAPIHTYTHTYIHTYIHT